MEGVKPPGEVEKLLHERARAVPAGPHTLNPPLMLEFPPELIVHKGNVYHLLYVVGGLLMTATAGSRCVDVAVRTAQNPANLLRLSNTLAGLMGLRHQIHVVNSTGKHKLKRLHFTHSFKILLDMTRTPLLGTPDFKVLPWFPVTSEKPSNLALTSSNCISAKRCRICYILICGVSSRPVWTLLIGNNSSKLTTYNPLNQLRWLIRFSSEARARGDVVFLLLGGQTGQMRAGSATNEPTSLTLGLSALCIVLLWAFLPHIAVCAVICLVWRVQQRVH